MKGGKAWWQNGPAKWIAVMLVFSGLVSAIAVSHAGTTHRADAIETAILWHVDRDSAETASRVERRDRQMAKFDKTLEAIQGNQRRHGIIIERIATKMDLSTDVN